MADIQSKILSKYGIDIAQENVFKLYKIQEPDISSQELEEKIVQTRKRWNQSVNGANETTAQRDGARLEKADKYEQILKNEKLRKEIFDFYNGEKSQKPDKKKSSLSGVEFAREYFEILDTSKKIDRQDVEFFFNYYQSERAHKKSILEMLESEYKIVGLKKEKERSDAEGRQPEEANEKQKDSNSHLVVNLFQKPTVLNIKKVITYYESAAEKEEVCEKYPLLRDSLYDFLEIDDISEIEELGKQISDKKNAVYETRQDRGDAFIPLVDMMNLLSQIIGYKDVIDNVPEFKLLLKFPSLTPYMYSFVEMKKKTLSGIVEVAKREYSFRNETDFILNYYDQIQDNFGITNIGISKAIKSAHRKALQNKVLNGIDKAIGKKKKARILPFGAKVIHFLVYWPIFFVYLIFEIVKDIVTELHKAFIPIMVFGVIILNLVLPKYGFYNFMALKTMTNGDKWKVFLMELFKIREIHNIAEIIILSLVFIMGLLALYVVPSVMTAFFAKDFAENINKIYDWKGRERTFGEIFSIFKRKAEMAYKQNKKNYYLKRILRIVVNFVCLAMVIGAVAFSAPRISKFNNRVFNKSKTSFEVNPDASIRSICYVKRDTSMRMGPSTDFDTIFVAKKGEEYVKTGNKKTASNGSIWYEVYIDKEKTKTGWLGRANILVKD